MVLILGDYLGPQGVGEGENCVYFTDEEGKMGVTSHLMTLVTRTAFLFLEDTNRAPRV